MKLRRSAQVGFTLVELMVTVLVVAVLVGIAVPTYTSQVQKSRRTDAKSALLDLAGREERYMSTATSYSQTTTDLGYTGSFPQPIGAGYYNVNVTTNAGPPATFTVTATPVAGNSQAKDTTCASFTVNNLGQRLATDINGADTTTTCWGSN
jgi:type IV pilus assembly protein PilE